MTPETNNTNPPEQDVIANYANDLKQFEIEGYERAVKKARTALFIAAGLIFLSEMIGMYRLYDGFDPLIFGIAVIEAGIFVGLALWTKTKPYTAVLTGLIVFIGFIILSVVVNGMTDGGMGVGKAIFSGIIFKVIILVNLISPLKDAKALQEAKKEQF